MLRKYKLKHKRKLRTNKPRRILQIYRLKRQIANRHRIFLILQNGY